MKRRSLLVAATAAGLVLGSGCAPVVGAGMGPGLRLGLGSELQLGAASCMLLGTSVPGEYAPSAAALAGANMQQAALLQAKYSFGYNSAQARESRMKRLARGGC